MSTKQVVLRSGLDEAQLERLAIFNEELGENVQVFGKIIRFGYGSFHPSDPTMTNNRELLEKEVGDILIAIEMMVRAGDLNRNRIFKHMGTKVDKLRQFICVEENLKYIPNNIPKVQDEIVPGEVIDYPDDPQWDRFGLLE